MTVDSAKKRGGRPLAAQYRGKNALGALPAGD
jgi:hypothetical protein